MMNGKFFMMKKTQRPTYDLAHLMKNCNFGKGKHTKMKVPRTGIIIHVFALLHVITALICRSVGSLDEIWLTILTITMVVLIAIRMKAKVELIAASVIVTNLLGFILGTYGAKALTMISGSELFIHSLSTFVTTEAVGWGIFGFLVLFRKNSRDFHSGILLRNGPVRTIRKEHILWLALALLLVLVFRISLTQLFPSGLLESGGMLDTIASVFSSPGVMIIMLCIIILMVRYMRIRYRRWGIISKTFLTVAIGCVISAATALYAGSGIFHGNTGWLTATDFTRMSVAVLTVYLIFYSAVYMIDYAVSARAAMYEARGQADQAQFQYRQLRQQVNPHFLFNSLNILDCMVRDGQTEHASAYIHKLAGIYRYMLRTDNRTVPLKDELTFMTMYTDLLKERFNDGFKVTDMIPEKTALSYHVIPCSIQMLIENAIKHNRIGEDCPFEIILEEEDGCITVTNTLRPKLGTVDSTHIGLDYLKRQYRLQGKEVTVVNDGKTFRVSIPLLPPQAMASTGEDRGKEE